MDGETAQGGRALLHFELQLSSCIGCHSGVPSVRSDPMNTPVMKKAVASFIDEAESIKSAISTETNGFKRSALEARLRGVENRFMAGLKQMGIRNESEARNLMRKVYETGGETQRGIEKVFTPMMSGAR